MTKSKYTRTHPVLALRLATGSGRITVLECLFPLSLRIMRSAGFL